MSNLPPEPAGQQHGERRAKQGAAGAEGGQRNSHGQDQFLCGSKTISSVSQRSGSGAERRATAQIVRQVP